MSVRTNTEAIETLRALLPVGSTIYTNLRNVSSSGMGRTISLHIVEDGEIRDISWLVSQVTHFKQDPKRDGLRVGGVGMDMGFHVVYELSRVLYSEGHKCTGSDGYSEHPSSENGWTGKKSKTPACPSNDHSNDYGSLSWKYDEDHADEKNAATVEGWPSDEYVTARWEWIDAQPLYTRRRKHRDGGYAIRQRWI